MGQRRQQKMRDGFTEGAWVSLAVKALRLGWPAGLRQAAHRVPPSRMRQTLQCGIFEDVFPATAELADVVAEIAAADFDSLCARQTHHARGYTAQFCRLEREAVKAAVDQRRELYAEAKRLGCRIPPRAVNCFYTWQRIAPQDAGVRREPDPARWQGMPIAVLDGHTQEGRKYRQRITLLSGHYVNHARLAMLVAEFGWDYIRSEVHRRHARPEGNWTPELFT